MGWQKLHRNNWNIATVGLFAGVCGCSTGPLCNERSWPVKCRGAAGDEGKKAESGYELKWTELPQDQALRQSKLLNTKDRAPSEQNKANTIARVQNDNLQWRFFRRIQIIDDWIPSNKTFRESKVKQATGITVSIGKSPQKKKDLPRKEQELDTELGPQRIQLAFTAK